MLPTDYCLGRKGAVAMAQFEARTSTETERVVVSLSGEIDLATREELTKTLLAAVAESPVVVVDLDALTFLDSSGLHALLTAHQAAERDGSRLFVVNAGGVVADLLNLTGVADLLSPPVGGGAADV